VARTTTEVGSDAETTAAATLVRLGYRILTRNYRVKSGELDLVAEDGKILCFVEVRSRANADHGTPEETISRAKRRRLAIAAQHYLTKHRREDAHCRFDVVAIEGTTVRVLKDAFRLDDC
jgi:putative endonuclease